MGQYSDYNIIPLGDHCATSILLKELNLRYKSYPFDWVTKADHLHDTNIMYNIQLINDLTSSDTVDDIVKSYMGDAFDTGSKVNSATTIWFPHDTESKAEVFEKYKRRFSRLKEDLHKKTLFILLTRHYYIKPEIFKQITEDLLKYNSDSVLLFISGTNHTYFETANYKNVIFKYIEYDISQFYNYDYSAFRPNIKKYLATLLM